jgi:superfamily II DNA/RNA helicase
MLVLAPTRELAVQIKEEADKFGRSGGIRNTFAPAFYVLDSLMLGFFAVV